MRRLGQLLCALITCITPFIVPPTIATACSCGQTTFVSRQSGPKHVAIVARVVSVSVEGRIKGKKAGRDAEAEVIQYFWGPRQQIFSRNTIRLRGLRGACTDFYFIEDKSYFISGAAEDDGTVSVMSCGFSGELEWDRSELNVRAIAFGPVEGNGAVLGKIYDVSTKKYAANIDVTLKSDSGEFHTKTSDDGSYFLTGVPEGEYHANMPGWLHRGRPIRVLSGEYTDGSFEVSRETSH